jgi:peptide/nickel transport system substrate-binding protein
MNEEKNYWQRRVSRRRLMAAGGIAAGAAFAGSTLACKTSPSPSGETNPSQSQASAGAPQPGGTLNLFQQNSPTTLDVHRTSSFYTMIPAGAVQSRLVRFKAGADPKVAENRDIENDLAASIESPDAITWTIKLRPDAKFHNVPPVSGHAVEAEDIKATFVRAVDPKNPSVGSLDMIDPAGITTPDKNTVVFKLKYAYAPFSKTLASPTYSWIFPREALAGSYDPAKTLIGSGPFLFDTYTPDVTINFKKNPEWFEKGYPLVDAIHVAIIPDPSQQKAQFTGGNVDLLSQPGASGSYIAAKDLDTVKRENPKAILFTGAPLTGLVDYVQLGDKASPFQDIRLRQAFSMALDRDAIGKAVYLGQGQQEFFMNPAMGKWAIKLSDLPSATQANYKFDPSNAKKLLDAAGQSGTQFKLDMVKGFLGQEYETAAETKANMLNAAGIKTTLVAVDYQKDYIGGGKGLRSGNYPGDQIVANGISGFTEADEFIFNYFSSKASNTPTKLNDPDLDAQLTKARTIVPEDERLKAYLDIQKYLASKMYTINGFLVPTVYLMLQPKVQGFRYSVDYGAMTESFAWSWLKKS